MEHVKPCVRVAESKDWILKTFARIQRFHYNPRLLQSAIAVNMNQGRQNANMTD